MVISSSHSYSKSDLDVLKINTAKKNNIKRLTNKEACQAFYSRVAESNDPRSKGMYYHYAYVDLGFQLKQKWIKSEKNGKYSNIIIRDEDGYFVVGNIYYLQ